MSAGEPEPPAMNRIGLVGKACRDPSTVLRTRLVEGFCADAGATAATVAIATGIAAAIPAVIAYNYFIGQIKKVAVDMECFAQDENMLRIAAWHSHIFGGIKLQVRESEAQAAVAILQHTAPIEEE